MADPTTTPNESPETTETQPIDAPKKKAAERIADLEVQLAEGAARQQILEQQIAGLVAGLDEKLAHAVQLAQRQPPIDDARAEQAESRFAEAVDRIQSIERNMDRFVGDLETSLEKKFGPLLERMRASTEDVQKAIDTTPARQLGQLMLDDRMSEADILERVRAIRAGKLAPDKATRFRTDARIWPDPKTPLAKEHAGKTIPLRTEVTRGDFTPASLEHHIACGALIPIA